MVDPVPITATAPEPVAPEPAAAVPEVPPLGEAPMERDTKAAERRGTKRPDLEEACKALFAMGWLKICWQGRLKESKPLETA